MSRQPGEGAPPLMVVESVRCLACGVAYAKPVDGGTVRENPGCPECGYVGWMENDPAAFTEEWSPARSAAGRHPHRSD